MTKTAFAGLELLPPGAPLSTDNYAFQAQNPTITDFLLKVGALLHRHDAHAAMANPTTAPTLAVSASGGSIPAGTTVYVAYTLNDPDGGETLASEVAQITTPAGYSDPTDAPVAAVSFAAGELLANTYLYAATVTDGQGGETALSVPVSVTVPPSAMAEVTISALTALTNDASGTSATAGWRLWRSIDGGNTWWLMATGAAATDTWTDTGAAAGDCSVSPPTEGTTGGGCSLTVTVPSAGQPTEATLFNIYGCTDGAFLSPCALAIALPPADYDQAQTFTSLTAQTGAPPAVSSCLPGANKLNPDTDLLNWSWKSPVASYGALPTTGNSDGDVRVVADTGANAQQIVIWSEALGAWQPWSPQAQAVVRSSQQQGAYQFTAADIGTVVECTDANAQTWTIPLNLGQVGAVFEVCQVGAGTVTIAGAEGVTIDIPTGYSATTYDQWGTIGLRQRAANEWVVSGNMGWVG